MSETYENQKPECYYSSGVFKVDYKSAGYKDLMEIAKEWSKDSAFYHLEVRRVSPENRGIQFVYYNPDLKDSTESKGGPIKNTYKKELLEKFGKAFYAWDYTECDELPSERVVVSKAII